MKNPIPINIVVEDDLSEVVARKVLSLSQPEFAIGPCYGKSGYGYIKKRLGAFNSAARGTPYLVIADLEVDCPPSQIQNWLGVPISNNLLFRIAVMEIESWVMADRASFSSFLGIREELIPVDVDSLDNPKQFLIGLARRSRNNKLKRAIVPESDSTARVGPDYNGQLSLFVKDRWDLREAVKYSNSLCRAVSAINSFRPTWGKK